MDPATLIPTPDAIPVHQIWFQCLLLLTFFFHILLMNVMLGTAFIGLAGYFRRNGSSPCSEAVSRNLPFAIAFAVNFGIAPLLFLQVLYGQFMYTSSILMAVFWLSIVALLIGAYSLAYVYKYCYIRLGKWQVVIAGLIMAMLLTIAFFFANNLTMMQSPASWSRYFDQPHGLLLNLSDPMLLPRFLHFMASAVAIGGLTIALYFLWKHKHGDPAAAPWIDYGCSWFSSATLVNLAIGLWFLTSLPAGTLTTSNPTGMFLLLTLTGGIVLAIPAILYAREARVLPALFFVLPTIALMIVARSLLRTALLAPWFSVEHLPVAPSTAPLLLFLFFLATGLALIVWMVRFTLRSCRDEGEVRP